MARPRFVSLGGKSRRYKLAGTDDTVSRRRRDKLIRQYDYLRRLKPPRGKSATRILVGKTRAEYDNALQALSHNKYVLAIGVYVAYSHDIYRAIQFMRPPNETMNGDEVTEAIFNGEFLYKETDKTRSARRKPRKEFDLKYKGIVLHIHFKKQYLTERKSPLVKQRKTSHVKSKRNTKRRGNRENKRRKAK